MRSTEVALDESLLDAECRSSAGNLMKTTTPDKLGSSTATDDFSPTAMFELLASDHRRYALHYLSQKVGAVSVCDLAEQIAICEADPTYDRYERILTGLHHIHLPKLADANVVRYDVEQETVELRDAVDSLTPHLDLTSAYDFQ